MEKEISKQSGKLKKVTWIQISALVVIAVLILGIYIYKKSTGDLEITGEADYDHTSLPKLVELGSTTCIPCQKMKPVLEELKEEYKGKVIIKTYDINKNREAAYQYKIKVIPTIILFNSKGEEVARGEGYMPKDVIVKAFKDYLGVE